MAESSMLNKILQDGSVQNSYRLPSSTIKGVGQTSGEDAYDKDLSDLPNYRTRSWRDYYNYRVFRPKTLE